MSKLNGDVSLVYSTQCPKENNVARQNGSIRKKGKERIISFGLRLQKKVIDKYILPCIKMKLSNLNSILIQLTRLEVQVELRLFCFHTK